PLIPQCGYICRVHIGFFFHHPAPRLPVREIPLDFRHSREGLRYGIVCRSSQEFERLEVMTSLVVKGWLQGVFQGRFYCHITRPSGPEPPPRTPRIATSSAQDAHQAHPATTARGPCLFGFRCPENRTWRMMLGIFGI